MSFLHAGPDTAEQCARECLARQIELQEIINNRFILMDLKLQIMNAQITLFLTKANTTLDSILAALAAGGATTPPLGADDLAGLAAFQARLDAELAAVKTAPNVVSITSSGTVATVTDVAHGFTAVPATTVAIAGATGPDAALFNGTFPITVLTPDTFTYVMAGVPASPTATGTITATKV